MMADALAIARLLVQPVPWQGPRTCSRALDPPAVGLGKCVPIIKSQSLLGPALTGESAPTHTQSGQCAHPVAHMGYLAVSASLATVF